ncbi:hypothetical protein CLV51_103699 [Chitinophaga niastensis]|uniref:Uncharacterized protein n=1 Tax=Chitinophaga niastensis TaxID=536980 RepID=A0A2P8HKH0_CHINA|nr:hypothetical protein [Chitinophaga niastensis]PSL46718.1 hypothetical protein CLV51_103699 [Chitinophaga niastensis]
MKNQITKTSENTGRSVAVSHSETSSNDTPAFQFTDNREEAVTQRKLQVMANNSAQVRQLKSLQEMANYNRPASVIQKMDGDPKDMKADIPPVAAAAAVVPAAAAAATAVPYNKVDNVGWRLTKNGSVIMFELVDGTTFSTSGTKEFEHVIDILWQQERITELVNLAIAVSAAGKETADKVSAAMLFTGYKDQINNVLKRKRATYVSSGSDLNDFLIYTGQLFSWTPEMLNNRLLLNPKWGGKPNEPNIIRKKIISVALEARKTLTKPQKDLWENNAGDYTEESDLGLVDKRISNYAAKVKAFAESIKGKKVEAIKQLNELYTIAAVELLPELYKTGLFPPLELVPMGEDCTFSREAWKMRIDYKPMPLVVMSELSASVLHETRHVEQAWALSTIAKKKIPVNADIVKKIGKGCPYPADIGKQVKDTATRGESFHVKWEEVEKLQGMLSLTLKDDAAVESVDWSLLKKYFDLIYWYYNHPREYDAYASEQVYTHAYKKLK